MLMARRRLADASLEGGAESPEWLQQKWRELYSPRSEAVELPFWTAALLSKVAARQDLPEAIGEMRRQATPLRAHRAGSNSALREGRTKEIDVLTKAMAGDVKGLTGWLKTGSDLTAEILGAGATAVLTTYAPGVPTELVAPAKKAAAVMGNNDWLAKLSVQLFRPHLHFIMKMAKDSQTMQHTLRRAASVFDFRGRSRLSRCCSCNTLET